MLTKFFGKSAPINYLLLAIVLLSGTLAFNLLLFPTTKSPIQIVATGILLVFVMLLLDFVIRKNRLNKSNNYGIYIFVLLVLMIPQAALRDHIMWSTLFSLLALRRMFSLYSSRNVEKKILDASLWIAIASVFSFYCVLLLPLLYYAIVVQTQLRFNHLVIPILGFAATALIFSAIWIVLFDELNWYDQFVFVPNLDFSNYTDPGLLLLLAVFVLLSIATVITTLMRLKSLNRKARPFYMLLPLSLFVLSLCVLTAGQKDGGEWMLLLPMLAAGGATVVESMAGKAIKEGLLWLLMVCPVLLWILWK